MSLDIACTMVDADNVPVRGSIVLRQLDTGRRSEASVVIEAGSTGELADDGVYRLTERVLGLGEKSWQVDIRASDYTVQPVPYEELVTAYGCGVSTLHHAASGGSVDLTAIRARVTALEALGGATGGFDPSTILSRIAADEGNLAAAILRVTSQEEITNDLLGDTPAVWVANTHYIPGTVVKHDGALWRCLVNGSLAVPGDDEDWKEINLQRMQDDVLHETYTLPNDPLTVGALRMMKVGDTYTLPTTSAAIDPGSSSMMDVADTRLVGIQDRGHRLINAVMVRTGSQTWTITAEEYTGTADSPVVTWVVDVDSAWPDNTGIGGVPGTSFTNVVFDLRREIGDASVFGADSVVGKIQALEAALHAASARIGVLETSGGGTSAHQTVAAEWTMPVNDQGPNYMIITDDKTDPDHIGIDLLDGAEHKVALAWKAGFDPTKVDDGIGGTENWDVTPPSVWVQSGTVFKQIVDPVTKAVVTYGAVKHFVDGHSILTLLWNSTAGHFEIKKVEHGA